jgi:uncharacterized membrane protein HdeD (DUF308 family)
LANQVSSTTARNESEENDMSSEGRYRQRMNRFAENWRAVALRGLIVLLFGLVVLLWPGLILTLLTLLFGVYALVDGALTLVPWLRTSYRGARKWLPLTEGAVGVIAGAVALLWPGMTVSGLLYVIVGWAVVTGVLKILTAVVLRREIEDRRPLFLGGVLSMLFGAILGVLLAALADADLPSLARLVGALAVVVGLAMITFAIRLRDRRD